jgi:carboxylesterase type B
MTTSTIRTDFGTFIGKNEDGVVQFLGIKYAELEDQLCEPRMKRNYGRSADHVVDATSFG